MDTHQGKTWTCTTCGQGFTRKTSARRHNDHLHKRQANVIRPLEYLVERLSGRLPPPQDPLNYRRSGMYRLGNEPHTVAHDTHGTFDSYIFGQSDYSPNPRSEAKSTENWASRSNERFIIDAKLKELAVLLNRNCPPDEARLLLTGITMNVNAGNVNILDAYLNLLRTLDHSKR